MVTPFASIVRQVRLTNSQLLGGLGTRGRGSENLESIRRATGRNELLSNPWLRLPTLPVDAQRRKADDRERPE